VELAILVGMRSIADDLRIESRRDLAGRTPAERIALAFRLGDDDIALVCAARGLTPDDARRLIAGSRQHGRIRSAGAGDAGT
jgi:hypothetical protein